MTRAPVADILPALWPTKSLRDVPADGALLWRYMTFSRFVALLDCGQLWFSRADQFPDGFEGTYGGLNAQRRTTSWGEARGPTFIERKKREIAYFRRRTYLNCWHESDVESAAMWDSYGRAKEAVAIVVPFHALRSLLPPSVALVKVRYVDFATTFVSEGSSTDAFLYKRKSFAHEQEVRAILQAQGDIRSEEDLDSEHPPKGILLADGILSRIQRINVAPTASDFFLDLVRRVTVKYAVDVIPARSSLDDDPVF
jgi:hypothetical protein